MKKLILVLFIVLFLGGCNTDTGQYNANNTDLEENILIVKNTIDDLQNELNLINQRIVDNNVEKTIIQERIVEVPIEVEKIVEIEVEKIVEIEKYIDEYNFYTIIEDFNADIYYIKGNERYNYEVRFGADKIFKATIKYYIDDELQGETEPITIGMGYYHSLLDNYDSKTAYTMTLEQYTIYDFESIKEQFDFHIT